MVERVTQLATPYFIQVYYESLARRLSVAIEQRF
jgi:hypothetical protein